MPLRLNMQKGIINFALGAHQISTKVSSPQELSE